jgi:hypothetical protein
MRALAAGRGWLRRSALGAGRAIGLGCIAASLLGSTARAEVRAAVFDFELVDTSLEGSVSGSREDEARRLGAVSDKLRELLAAAGVAAADLAPVRDRLQRASPLRTCNGCELDLARQLGTDLVVTGVVQKVSNLILSFNVVIRDARTGAVVRTGSTDIRGNTEETWLRGLSYLVRNRLLDPPLPGITAR